MQAIINQASCHYVFIADDDGMNYIFPDLRQKLAHRSGNHITLIYYSFGGSFIFSRELDILLKRFPTQLLMYKIAAEPNGTPVVPQELLEAILNSNTKDSIAFILACDNELSSLATDELWFLGVKNASITSIF